MIPLNLNQKLAAMAKRFRVNAAEDRMLARKEYSDRGKAYYLGAADYADHAAKQIEGLLGKKKGGASNG